MAKTVNILSSDLNELLRDPFVDLEKLKGVVYRHQPGRKTIAFPHHEKTYFAKIHTGVGWKEIFKNLFQIRWPIISAEPEWDALLKLKKLGIKAPLPVAFGKQGINPARLKSFIITEAITSTMSLEEFLKTKNVPTHSPTCREQVAAVARRRVGRGEQLPKNTIEFPVKKRFIEVVASIAKTLHENGINHRDFYLCHFLLNSQQVDLLKSEIYLIDLHRAQCRNKVPFRWRVKDIAGLYFSTMNFNFTARDYLRFIRGYTGQPLRSTLKQDKFFWRTVTIKARKLYRKFYLTYRQSENP